MYDDDDKLTKQLKNLAEMGKDVEQLQGQLKCNVSNQIKISKSILNEE